MKLVNFFIEEPMLLELDAAVQADLWSSRSAFIRNAIAEKLAQIRPSLKMLSDLQEALEDFDERYLECWRDKERTERLVLEIEELETALADTLTYAQIRQLESKAKLLPDARARIRNTAMSETERVRNLIKLREIRNLASLRGQDTSTLDALLEFLESKRTNAKD